MDISYGRDMRSLHTFGLSSRAEAYAAVHTPAEVLAAIDRFGGAPSLILGGGSNILPLGYIPGLVLHNQLKGIEVEAETDSHVWLSAGGGVVWHELVMESLSHAYGGLENLALIPGSAGAAPIQNIGAYGLELKDVFARLEAIDLTTGETVVFEEADCRFGYRDSVFKQEVKGQYFISRLVLRLTRKDHAIRTDYGAIGAQLAAEGITTPDIGSVAQAVMQIRSSKLPDWRQLGNAGSFFKNPLVPELQALALQEQYPQMPLFAQGAGWVKLAAGWLIDQCGWKGQRDGAVGCYDKQALVLVNYGGATGEEVLAFSEKIMDSVNERFGVRLEREVNVVGVLGEG